MHKYMEFYAVYYTKYAIKSILFPDFLIKLQKYIIISYILDYKFILTRISYSVL